MNGRYDPSTGVIDIALDADGNAYAYVAMHELTHKMKAEHAKDFDTFAEWVQECLQESGQDFEALVQYQMDTFGYSREDAIEEVLCNTVPALLESEENLRKLYRQDKSLFERVMDWLKGLIADVQAAGKNLSQRSRSWAQMDALAADEAQLQGLYDVMESIMQSEGEQIDSSISDMQYSLRETETMSWKEQVTKTSKRMLPRSAILSIGKSGSLFGEFSMQDKPIGMNQSDLRKITRKPKGSRSAHSIKEEIILQLPKAIQNPVAIFDNPNRNCVYVVTDLNDSGGRPVVATIEKDQKDDAGTPMHQVKSAHGMKDIMQYMYDHLPKESHYHVYKKENFTTRAGGQHTMIAADYPASGSFKQMITKKSSPVKNSLSDYDSTGATLSSEQQAYFANSKIRDEQGRLMVMYHGTPSGNYEHFRSGTYFTPNREYADVYQNPGASSISYGKKQDAPTTFAMYLNMEKPFDTRNPKERSIFMKEYYRKYGTGAPLSESGLPDWTDGMDLQEFIEEMEYDYDGLILDEGGVPDGDGGVKSRGLSYVIFDPAQAKAVDNKTPTEDKRFRFSMSDMVEETRDLRIRSVC